MAERLPRGYHSPQVDVEVRLNTNEAPAGPPPAFVEALSRALGELNFNRYPDREARRLRAAVGERHGVGPEQVLCTNGSNESISLLLATAGGPGRTAVVFGPTYALHAHLSRLAGMEVLEFERDPVDFALSAETVTRAVSGPSDVVFLCRPNNPTGTLDGTDVIGAATAGRGLTVVDEAYAEFAGLPAGPPPAGAAVTRTFSKAFGIAALRLGYVVADADLVEELVERALPYHLDALKQAAGLAALELVGSLEPMIAQVIDERTELLAGLRDLGVQAWDSSANFILFRPEGTAGEIWAALVERSILVRDLSGLPGLANCLRVTVGTPEENLRFLDALSAII